MNNNQNTNIAKCPNCGTPAQDTEISEVCLLTKEAEPCFEGLLASCINPVTLSEFNASGLGADPCEHCQHNLITENPGTFVKMKRLSANQWTEIHQCPVCQTTYEVSTSTTD